VFIYTTGSIRGQTLKIITETEEIIMKKKFNLEDLDCANCAAKMEAAIKEIPGVVNASVNFLAQKMTIEAPDEQFDDIVKKAVECIAKVEPDCKVIL
jgi:copper chaperone CopZ